MKKCITFGKWDPNYKYIFLSIIFLALYKMTTGISLDGNPNYSFRFYDSRTFSANYLIHDIFLYFICIIISIFIVLIEKIMNLRLGEEKIKEKYLKIIPFVNKSQINDISFIYTKAKGKTYSIFFILFIIFIDILLGQFSLIYNKFFIHINFWMVELYFVAFLYLKMLQIKIYKHQKLAFAINIISIILVFVKVFLTIEENDEKKAIYVKYWWFIFIGPIIFLIYAFALSYVFVTLKKFFYYKFVPVSRIFLFNSIIGFLFCISLCSIFTYNSCGNKNENIHEVKDYVCKVTNSENKTFIDNFNVYLVKWENSNKNDKIYEILNSVFGNIFFALYRYFSFKIIESLTPFHRIFSGSVYYLAQQLILLSVYCVKIINDDNIHLKVIVLTDFFSDFVCIITFFIYSEIIELNFCNFNYNLKKNIILRGQNDDIQLMDLNRSSINGDDDDVSISEIGDRKTKYSINDDYYVDEQKFQ